MSRRSRWKYLKAIYRRYRQTDRGSKRVILDKFGSNTGYHRQYAIRLLNGPLPDGLGPRSASGQNWGEAQREHSPARADGLEAAEIWDLFHIPHKAFLE